jgi:predicted enzyme related to lactoylglutathione lyase
MSVTGPDFISLQVRDLEASASFYETFLDLTRQPGPPHAVVFDTKPAAFAVRGLAEGFTPEPTAKLGQGMGLWMHATDVDTIHDALAAAGHPIVLAPMDGPFGRTFTFADLDRYNVTLHDRA